MDDKKLNEVKTGIVRASYVSLFEKDKFGKYSLTIIIDKEDSTTISAVKVAMAEAIKEGKESVWKGKAPKKLELPLKDGDTEGDGAPELKGKYFIRLNAHRKVGLVGTMRDPETKKLIPIEDPNDFYSGCYCRVTMTCRAYNHEDISKGITFYLGNVQKIKDGEPLAGGRSADADFDDDFAVNESDDDFDLDALLK